MFDLVCIPLRQEAMIVDDSSPWVLDITDVYYNIALIGNEEICANLQNDIMVTVMCVLYSCINKNSDHVK